MPRKQSTIGDVAQAAGVSKTTVSRYINGRKDLLSASAQKRIELAIRKTHYRPNALARGLKSQRTGTLGIVIDGFASPASGLMQAIVDAATKWGYVALFVDGSGGMQAAAAAIASHQIDGLVICDPKEDEAVFSRRVGLPVTCIVDEIGAEEAGSDAVRRLAKLLASETT